MAPLPSGMTFVSRTTWETDPSVRDKPFAVAHLAQYRFTDGYQ
jgi:hypothetical protein